MQAFVDLQGASGAVYRYRLAPDGQVTSRIAGNYAFVREEEEGFAVLSAEATSDLSSATAAWRRAAAKHGELQLYTRLNVSAAVRETEQLDIAAYYKQRRSRPTG